MPDRKAERTFPLIASICLPSTERSLTKLMALGMTFALSVRGIDFSIAQVADAAAVISAFLILKDVPPMVALLITLLFGLFVGLVNFRRIQLFLSLYFPYFSLFLHGFLFIMEFVDAVQAQTLPPTFLQHLKL